ncbi:MAG: hypothetical protein RIS86_1251 [Planctomycetota bacterium]
MDAVSLLLSIAGGLVVGLSLGLVGAGGAILSMPIFAVVLGHGVGAAALEALAVTGVIALVSAVRNALVGRVDYARAAAFALPGIAGAWMGGPLAKSLDPRVQAALFSALSLVAAWRMLATAPQAAATAGRDADGGAGRASPRTILLSAACGSTIGVLTSVLGVGGGFLLVPALVLVTRAEMPIAVGTSLAVIAVNAAAGLASHAQADGAFGSIAWTPVAIVAACGIAGSLAGGRLGARLSQRALRRVFAALLVAVAALVLWRGAARGTGDRPGADAPSTDRVSAPSEPPSAGSAPPSARSTR